MTTAHVPLRREIADAEHRYAQLEEAFDASQERLSEYLSAQAECDRARDRLAELNRGALTGG